MNKLFMSVVSLCLLAACGSKPAKEPTAEVKPAAAAVTPATPATTSAATETAAVAATAVAAQAAAPAPTQPAVNVAAAETAPAGAVAAAAAPEAVAATPTAAVSAKSVEPSSVFFPLDVDAVQAADLDTILEKAEILAADGAMKARVEGNADERGSSEYNLALGQRRADNTRKALVLGGARVEQIETVSYGEENPRETGHDEDSWAQNRRADIVVRR